MPIQRAKPIAADIPVLNASSIPTINKTSLPAGSIIQTASKYLAPGVDFTNDQSTTSTSYIDIQAGNSNAILGVDLTDIKSTSYLVFTYECPMFYNNSESVLYNIYETVSQTYVVNNTTYSGAHATQTAAAAEWSSTSTSGTWGFTHVGKVGQYTGDCTFRVRLKHNGTPTNAHYYHWWSNRTGQSLVVQEIAG